MLALLKMGLDLESVLSMSVAEANSLLSAFDEIVNPVKPGKKYVVKRKAAAASGPPNRPK